MDERVLRRLLCCVRIVAKESRELADELFTVLSIQPGVAIILKNAKKDGGDPLLALQETEESLEDRLLQEEITRSTVEETIRATEGVHDRR